MASPPANMPSTEDQKLATPLRCSWSGWPTASLLAVANSATRSQPTAAYDTWLPLPQRSKKKQQLHFKNNTLRIVGGQGNHNMFLLKILRGISESNALFTQTKQGLIKQSFVKHDFAKLV